MEEGTTTIPDKLPRQQRVLKRKQRLVRLWPTRNPWSDSRAKQSRCCDENLFFIVARYEARSNDGKHVQASITMCGPEIKGRTALVSTSAEVSGLLPWDPNAAVMQLQSELVAMAACTPTALKPAIRCRSNTRPDR